MRVVLNSNKKKVEEVQKALAENDGYCPCQIGKNPDTKCMCKMFREQEEGLCFCELYSKEK